MLRCNCRYTWQPTCTSSQSRGAPADVLPASPPASPPPPFPPDKPLVPTHGYGYPSFLRAASSPFYATPSRASTTFLALSPPQFTYSFPAACCAPPPFPTCTSPSPPPRGPPGPGLPPVCPAKCDTSRSAGPVRPRRVNLMPRATGVSAAWLGGMSRQQFGGRLPGVGHWARAAWWGATAVTVAAGRSQPKLGGLGVGSTGVVSTA